MPVESATYISDLNTSNPVGSTDKVQTLDDHIRLIKSTLKTTFPSITGAVTATHTELNLLDGVTATTAELNQLAGAASGAGMVSDIAVLTDPNADRILFWDDSAGAVAQLAPDGTSIAISGTTLATGSNVPLLSGVNQFTATNEFTGLVRIFNTNPQFYLIESDAAADEATWRWSTSGGLIALAAIDDAGTGVTLPITLNRTGITVDSIALSATAVTINGGTAWHSGNDGTGSGLDADTVDGVHAATIIQTTGDQSMSGTKTFTGTVAIGSATISGAVTRPNSSASEVGYAGAPSRSITASDNTVAGDAGKTIKMTSGSGQTLTLDSDPPTDSIVYFVNTSGNNWTLAASGTLHSNTGTGSRTIPTSGSGYAIHLGSGSWAAVGVFA